MIIAGFGFRTDATLDSFADAYDKASGGVTVDAIATTIDAIDNPTFRQMAAEFGVAVAAINAQQIAAQTILSARPTTAPETSGAIAEAAALAAAGADARLIGPGVMSEDGLAACALAEGRAA